MKCIFLFLVTFTTASYAQKNIKKSFHWKSISDFPKSWIMLERDTTGYLIYDPCDGNTPAIEIHNDTLFIIGQLEGSKHLITSFTLNKKDLSYHITAQGEVTDGDTDKSIRVQIDVQVKDQVRKLVLWKININWGDGTEIYSMVMTPVEYKTFFRAIKNPCPDEKAIEKKKDFLPVEFH